MADVVLTAALRSNLQALQLTQALIDSTQLKLSTGKKVNSALDDPRSFFAAQTLSNRATDLNRLLDGIGQSIQTVKAADKGVESITTLVEQAESIANSAYEEVQDGGLQAGITGNVALDGIDDFIGTLTNAATNDTIVLNFVDEDGNAVALRDGDGAGTNTGYAHTLTFEDLGAPGANQHNVISSGDLINELNKVTRHSNGEQLVTAEYDSNGKLDIKVAAGYKMRVTFTDQGLAQDLGFSKYTSTLEYADATSGNNARVALTASNEAVMRSFAFTDNGNSNATATRNTTLANAYYNNAAKFVGDDTGDNLHVYVTTKSEGTKTVTDLLGSSIAFTANTIGQLIDAINDNSTLNPYIEAGFDEETGEITLQSVSDQVVSLHIGIQESTLADTGTANFGFGYLGSTNSSTSLSTTGANNNIESENLVFARGAAKLSSLETQYDSLLEQIDGIVDDASYAGVNLLDGHEMVTYFNEDRSSSLTTYGASLRYGDLGLETADFASSEKVNSFITQVRDALDTVRNFGSELANDLSVIQTRETFTKGLIETLNEGSDKLTLADQNEEGAKLLSLQTRQQLGITALSLASQSQQAILRLF